MQVNINVIREKEMHIKKLNENSRLLKELKLLLMLYSVIAAVLIFFSVTIIN